jgi:two-component system nitrogen regulation response regulator NtrX
LQKSKKEQATVFSHGSLRDARTAFEKAFIQRKLTEHDRNISKAADAMGIERSHLYKKMKAFGIKP